MPLMNIHIPMIHSSALSHIFKVSFLFPSSCGTYHTYLPLCNSRKLHICFPYYLYHSVVGPQPILSICTRPSSSNDCRTSLTDCETGGDSYAMFVELNRELTYAFHLRPKLKENRIAIRYDAIADVMHRHADLFQLFQLTNVVSFSHTGKER